jgi:hypothetical protein
MNNFARLIVLPMVSAGIIGGAALGLAGAASASTTTDNVTPPHTVARPNVKAHPAPDAMPSQIWQQGVWHLARPPAGLHPQTDL